MNHVEESCYFPKQIMVKSIDVSNFNTVNMQTSNLLTDDLPTSILLTSVPKHPFRSSKQDYLPSSNAFLFRSSNKFPLYQQYKSQILKTQKCLNYSACFSSCRNSLAAESEFVQVFESFEDPHDFFAGHRNTNSVCVWYLHGHRM